MRRRALLAALFALATLAAAAAIHARDAFITVASTTSTEASGLFGHLLPRFEAATGIGVRVVAVGTGQAFELGRRGDADVLLVHDPEGEEGFVAAGHGVERHEVMANDFVIVGPAADPAGIAGMADAAAALAAIAAADAPFVSRGDDSGTHRRELRLWREAGVEPAGRWYRETGSGMGATLNTAAAMDAYALADRGTWLAFANKQNLTVLVEGDPDLINPYGVILVDPERHPHVKAEAGQAFIDWLLSDAGQRAIAEFTIDGEPLFFPTAHEAGS